jgi:hypothetical protein
VGGPVEHALERERQGALIVGDPERQPGWAGHERADDPDAVDQETLGDMLRRQADDDESGLSDRHPHQPGRLALGPVEPEVEEVEGEREEVVGAQDRGAEVAVHTIGPARCFPTEVAATRTRHQPASASP